MISMSPNWGCGTPSKIAILWLINGLFKAYDTWDDPPSVTRTQQNNPLESSRLDRLRAKCTWCDGLGVSGRASHRQAQGVGNLAGVGLLQVFAGYYLCHLFFF